MSLHRDIVIVDWVNREERLGGRFCEDGTWERVDPTFADIGRAGARVMVANLDAMGSTYHEVSDPHPMDSCPFARNPRWCLFCNDPVDEHSPDDLARCTRAAPSSPPTETT